MLVFGTQMHVVTFIFVSIELVIFFYLVIYRMARPDDRQTSRNIILIALLLLYNVTGGLLPDPNLPGSFFIQTVIAYATGFIVPCYFPYYVYTSFGLDKMKFHAHKGVFLFLLFPYILFVIIYGVSGKLDIAKNLFVLPVLYAIWVICSLYIAIKYKYGNDFHGKKSREEVIVLFLSLTPWIGLPIIDYFNLGQDVEALITNGGFLLLLALQVKNHIIQMRVDHQQLLNWNTNLQNEVDKRTKELQQVTTQKLNAFVNLAHETKTPLTLINNYLEEYIAAKGNSEELSVVKRSFDKISTDIVNIFDLERFSKGIKIYDHSQVTSVSDILKDNLILFTQYAKKRNIELEADISDEIIVKADPVAINRLINNLVENAIRFSPDQGKIEVALQIVDDKIFFSVRDYGIGIPLEMHKKIFEPYYQIVHEKRSLQGMGLGLPIVKKVVEDLRGEIKIESNPQKMTGTKMTVILRKHNLAENEEVSPVRPVTNTFSDVEAIAIKDSVHDEYRPTILVVEDNLSMITYLIKKLSQTYNVYGALNGSDALNKIKSLPVIPDLIISDVMMDKVDGFTFARIISKDPAYTHIPFIFLSAISGKEEKLLGLKLGAIDFIQKPFSTEALLQKVASIVAQANKQKMAVLELAVKGSGIQHVLSNTIDTFETNANVYHLTAREKDIARLICQGYTYKVIGEKLFIAERTVTKHVQNIFEKVDVKNKIELIKKLEG